MLTALEKAKQNGATIVAINPLPEAGWQEFHNPQTIHGLAGSGTQLADDYLPIRIGGDQALFQSMGKLLLEAEEAAPGTAFDQDFLDARTTGLDAYLDQVRALDWAEIFSATGLSQAQIRALAARLLASKAAIVTWAMGLAQHKHAVATLRDIVNVLLLQGNIGAVHASRGRLEPPTGICSPKLPSSAGSAGGCSTAAPHGRRVVLVNAQDLTAFGLPEGTMVNLISEFSDGMECRAENFRTVAYPTPWAARAAY